MKERLINYDEIIESNGNILINDIHFTKNDIDIYYMSAYYNNFGVVELLDAKNAISIMGAKEIVAYMIKNNYKSYIEEV